MGGGDVGTRKHKHTHTQTLQLLYDLHLQGLQVQESSKTVVSYLLDSVVMKMPAKAKAVFTHICLIFKP